MIPMVNLSHYLMEHAESLAIEVVEGVIQRMNLNIPEWEEEQAIRTYLDLWEFLGQYLKDRDKGSIPEFFLEWSKKNSEMQVQSGGDISEIVKRYPPTRDVFNDIITRISMKFGLSVKENASIIKWINNTLDISLNETFSWFKHLNDKYKEEAEKELLNLSAPIVPIQDNIVIIPLIGKIDDDNTRHIEENVVPKIAEMQVNYVIADFSGALIDNQRILDLLDRIGKMLGLMDIRLVFTGLRPDLVKLIVNSNFEISNVDSFATVKQAVENIHNKVQMGES
ncbi:STAS domain-containing protein [Oceanobacillus salinisoli]|uniref:STAS domain-containing protein n=1 Tax=Oceanobacillus salinisoli TaxID=2678611 RepID=UPI0012E18636|nr:STAS domain-containing protein [Oceanobacillus salinisoli]